MREVAEDLVALHPGGRLTVEGLMSKASFEADGCTLKNWDLERMGLTALPESLGDLTLSRDLDLGFNKISTLPESFASITLGGNLYLSRNEISTLPESFGSVTVGGGLYLQNNNRLTTFPKSFPNVKGKVKK